MQFVFDDLQNGGSLFFDDLSTPFGSTASGTGTTGSVTAPLGSATDGLTTVVITDVSYTGTGSIFNGYVGTPTVGLIVRFPTDNGFLIDAAGIYSATVNSGSWVCHSSDDSGATWFDFTVVIQASSPGNASGAGVTITESGPAGSATASSPGNASGAGVTITESGPSGSATGGAQASGGGATITGSSPAGSAGSTALAQGSGTDGTVSGPAGSAIGGAHAVGSGVYDYIEPPQSNAYSYRLIVRNEVRVLVGLLVRPLKG